ncbi:hypothetical protein IG631_14076 [Alternaria alternata]|nr:hypothetical protein IG631_14076 [Alternaria alternata]
MAHYFVRRNQNEPVHRRSTMLVNFPEGRTQIEEKRHTQANSPDIFVALGAKEALLSASTSSSSRTVRPTGVKELEHAPRLDECIARLLSEMEDVKVPSPSFLTTRIRGKNNDSNGLVSALRLYPIQEVLVRYIFIKDLEAIACTSSALSNSLNLKETRQFWKFRVKNRRGSSSWKRMRHDAYLKALEDMPEPRKRELSGDEELPYAPPWRPQSRGPKRI